VALGEEKPMIPAVTVSLARSPLQNAYVQVSYGPMELGVQLEGDKETLRVCCEQVPGMAQDLLTEVASYQPIMRMKGCELAVKERWPRVVRRMVRSVQAVASNELTPMAAVAGAISDEVLLRLLEGSGGRLTRALVNNGGDMAVYSPHELVRVGIRGSGTTDESMREIVAPKMNIPYGIATSGWRGRSFSQGIADAVVVVGPEGAVADAAATHVGNHVGDEGIETVKRQKALQLDPETDIPNLWITVECGGLTRDEKKRAIKNGMDSAIRLLDEDMIWRLEIYLQGEKSELDTLGNGMEL